MLEATLLTLSLETGPDQQESSLLLPVYCGISAVPCQTAGDTLVPDLGWGCTQSLEVTGLNAHDLFLIFHPQRVQCEHSWQDARLQARVCPGHVVSVLWGTWKSLEIVQPDSMDGKVSSGWSVHLCVCVCVFRNKSCVA